MLVELKYQFDSDMQNVNRVLFVLLRLDLSQLLFFEGQGVISKDFKLT